MKKALLSYHNFIETARAASFTDDQIDFLWNMFAKVKPDPADFKAPGTP